MKKTLTLQIHITNEWKNLGVITLDDDEVKGYRGKTYFDYDLDYVSQFLGNQNYYSVSLNCPVNFETYHFSGWAPFLLDLIPQGAGRRYWEKKLGLTNNPSSDWSILLHGASNCVGHIRIKESVDFIQNLPGPLIGFSKKDIYQQKTKVLNEMEKLGIPIGTSSSVQGDAPKFFLSEGIDGKWYPGGLLDSKKIKQEWLIKFSRSSKQQDRLVLKMEEKYFHVAHFFGIKTYRPLEWIEDTLFIPRFDVQNKKNKTFRFGMESLASAMKIAEFGARPNQELYLKCISEFSTDPALDLQEYIRRDLLNICMGNTDNHPRNTAFIKDESSCRLSPIFDFAPMYLDTEGITRVCRWSADLEQAGLPHWKRILEYLNDNYPLEKLAQSSNKKENPNWTLFFKDLRKNLIRLNDHLDRFELNKNLIQECKKNIGLALKDFP